MIIKKILAGVTAALILSAMAAGTVCAAAGDEIVHLDFDDGTVTSPCRLPGASRRVMAATFPLQPAAFRRVRSRQSFAG